MLFPIDDTVTAQASARGAAYRGIVRISGPDSVGAIRQWFRMPSNNPHPHENQPFAAGHFPQIADGELTVWGDKLPVPCVLYYWPEGRGFTGQPSVELHTIGSQPLLDTVVRTLCESGCRLAGPGEFTLRAFLSGRIDLPQAEAVLGVIDADDGKQLEVALRQLAGGIGQPLAALRERLLETTCHLEAEFDFADDDIEFIDRDLLRQKLRTSAQLIEQTLQQMRQRTSTSERHCVVLIGRPNAGKSSLFNALIQSARQRNISTTISTNMVAAIVSPQPGTTRDRLEAEMQIGELSLTLFDTAGIEAVESIGDDQPRQLAQAVTREAVDPAELVLLCLESGKEPTESENAFLHDNADRTMIVRTKCDLYSASGFGLQTSAETGEGLPQLLAAMETRLQCKNAHGEVVPATALRCRESLSLAAESLHNALQLTETRHDDILIVTEMRIALEHIGQMTGAVHNDEILDRIFSRFCIGK